MPSIGGGVGDVDRAGDGAPRSTAVLAARTSSALSVISDLLPRRRGAALSLPVGVLRRSELADGRTER